MVAKSASVVYAENKHVFFLLPLVFTTLSVTKSHVGSVKVMCAVLVGELTWLHRC